MTHVEADGRGPAAWVALRPRHWIKNVFVLAPAVFAQRAGEPDLLLAALAAFAAFCAISSCVYLINDLLDRDADRRHPVKRLRPIASGALGPGAAAALAAALGVAGLAGAFALGLDVGWVALGYLALNLAYSLAFKRVVVLDVMIVAAGFILRAWAGALVVDVALSNWLVLCTGLLALFLGFVKRRQELTGAAGLEGGRPILREYTPAFLDQMISALTAATLVAYCLYAFSPEVARKLGTRYLELTVPFVVFGMFRYLYLVHVRGRGESPTALLYSDLPLLADLALWGASVLLVLYVWR